LTQTITFQMIGSAKSGRMIAVYQRPCSARMTASALLRASISAEASLLRRSDDVEGASIARIVKFNVISKL
jgi:hypothetical protein